MNSRLEETPGATNASFDALAGQMATAEKQGLSDLIRTLTKLASEFSGLVLLESKLAIASVPRYFEFTFLKLFMLICVWLSFSGCVMWLIVLAANSVLLGLIAMTGLQLLGYFICKKMQDSYRHKLTLPHSRQQLIQLGESINESIKAATHAG